MTGPPNLGFALRDPHPWQDLVSLARLGEALGYGTLFLPEVGARDTLATLAGLAGLTSELRLATGVAPLPARSPRLLAMAAATVQEMSAGRLILGLGTGPARPGALDRLRRTVVALKTVLATGRGELEGTPLDVGLVPATPPPVWVAALGPKAARLAGEVADGVVLNWCTPERVLEARRQVGEGAEAAGRDPDSITIAVYIRACVSTDPSPATALRAAAAEYASYPAYARQFDRMGLGGEAAQAAAAHEARDPSRVPDRLVEAVTLMGEGARARLDAYRTAGAAVPVIYPVPAGGGPVAASVVATLEAFAPGIGAEVAGDPWRDKI